MMNERYAIISIKHCNENVLVVCEYCYSFVSLAVSRESATRLSGAMIGSFFTYVLLTKTVSQKMSISNKVKGKGSFYIAQYPVRWTAQSASHFLPSLTDLFILTTTRLLQEAF